MGIWSSGMIGREVPSLILRMPHSLNIVYYNFSVQILIMKYFSSLIKDFNNEVFQFTY